LISYDNGTARNQFFFGVDPSLPSSQGDSIHTIHMQPRPKTRQASHSYRLALILLIVLSAAHAVPQPSPQHRITLTVLDENSLPVPDASVTISSTGRAALQAQTDYAGRCMFNLSSGTPYQIRVDKPGFYQSLNLSPDPHADSIEITVAHQQIVQQQITVTASNPGIDPEQTSDNTFLGLPEIVNIPYPTSRDIRNLLPFIPGIVQDNFGQLHVAGSETYATLDLLDGFDIRSPISGDLAMRVSADAVRSIDTETTRYPVEYGRATGGVIAFWTGMGDDKFRFNATNFIPSVRDNNGLRFDQFVPRFTFSGPIVRNRAWFFDGLELEYDDIYIPELPSDADTNHLIRGSNLSRSQINLSTANILTVGLLFNDYHSPYDGISALVPQQSTVHTDIAAWLPYIRDEHTFHNGAVLDSGFAVIRFRDGYSPHGDTPFELTPELAQGSYFENGLSHSQREQFTETLYLPSLHWLGRHDLKTGIELNHIGYDETYTRAPVNYLREDGTLTRQSTFPLIPTFTRHNVETGAYLQDRWSVKGNLGDLLIEPGLRFDWDEIIRHPLFAPRLAAAWTPHGQGSGTKISAGVGLYYEHTQLEYLTRALAGLRTDTYFAADGITPITPALLTSFQANDSTLRQTRTLNWSVALEQKLPGEVFLNAGFLEKHTSDGFVYANPNPASLSGTWLLTNDGQDRYHSFEIDARRSFRDGYTVFAAYTRSSAHTNTAIDYTPTLSPIGPQQPGPLPWDAPNRLISWGWLPIPIARLHHNWDFVYTMLWQTGFPYTSIDANHQVVGAPGSNRFPDYISFSPGLEWRFHLRGAYFGLRGVLENATDSLDPITVNNNVDSPAYGTFSQPLGRALTARIRLIGSK
jgi:hypothetical protein